jgi:hypothetical protein
MVCLGLHNKPKAEVHPGHKLTGPKEKEEEDENLRQEANLNDNVVITPLEQYTFNTILLAYVTYDLHFHNTHK